MFARVVAAGDVLECRFRMSGGRRIKKCPRPVACRKRGRNALHAPRAAQVQAVQVNKLRVGSVRHGRGCEERLWFALACPGEKLAEPCAELFRR